MLIISSLKKTPGTRHKIKPVTFKFIKINLKKNFKKINIFFNTKAKILNKVQSAYNTKNGIFRLPTIFLNYFLIKNSIKEYGLFTDIYGNKFIGSIVSVYYPGFKFYTNNYFFNYKLSYKLIGQTIPIIFVPLNMYVSYIYNFNNNKSTYSKSYGSNAIRQKISKKNKLVLVKLPSKILKFFNYNTLCIFSSNFFFKTKKLIEGSWGFSFKKKKLIKVRGVAKNPVDHPNGGRTKAKQPERSPWGWVAKHNK